MKSVISCPTCCPLQLTLTCGHGVCFSDWKWKLVHRRGALLLIRLLKTREAKNEPASWTEVLQWESWVLWPFRIWWCRTSKWFGGDKKDFDFCSRFYREPVQGGWRGIKVTYFPVLRRTWTAGYEINCGVLKTDSGSSLEVTNAWTNFFYFLFLSFLQVTVNGVDYQPQTASPNKKHAKAMAATVALQALGEVRLTS